MKILLVNAVFGYSSTGTIVKHLFDIIRLQNDEPHVLCMDSNTDDNQIYRVKKGLGNRVHALMTRMVGLQGCWSYLSSKRIIKEIQKQNPDIIHIHNLHSNFINLPLILEYCAKNNKPLVVTLHDCWYFTGKCYHFEDIGCNRWKESCGRCPKRMMDISSLLCDTSHLTFDIKKRLFNRVTNLQVVGCSQWITDKAKQSPVFQRADFSTIYNGVDTNIFNYQQAPAKVNSPFTVMVMANKWFLPENKLLRERLIELADSNIKLKIVGCNQTQLSENQSTDFISYIGYVKSREELAEHYRNSDLFLNVTFIDTLPTVNMEAICCGTPVVTYRSGGSPELVDEGITGYVVEQNDIEGIVSAINKINKYPLSRIRCAEIGKSRFDKDINYDKYINLYNHILSE